MLRVSYPSNTRVVRRIRSVVRSSSSMQDSGRTNPDLIVPADAVGKQASDAEVDSHTTRMENEYKMSNLQRGIAQAFETGEFEEGLETAQEARQFAEAAFGAQSVVVASVHNNIAVLNKKLGKWDEAERAYKVAITLYEAEYGAFHPSSVTAFSNLGVMLREKAELMSADPDDPQQQQAQVEALEKALGYSEEALLRRKRASGDERSALIGLAHMHVASSHRALKSLRLALRSLDDARPHITMTVPPSHPYVASLHNARGLVLKGLGRFSEAEKEYLTALSLREKALAGDHADVLMVLHNIAELEAARGDVSKSVGLREEILRRQEESALRSKGDSRYVEEDTDEEDSDDTGMNARRKAALERQRQANRAAESEAEQ